MLKNYIIYLLYCNIIIKFHYYGEYLFKYFIIYFIKLKYYNKCIIKSNCLLLIIIYHKHLKYSKRFSNLNK